MRGMIVNCMCSQLRHIAENSSNGESLSYFSFNEMLLVSCYKFQSLYLYFIIPVPSIVLIPVPSINLQSEINLKRFYN